MIAASLRSTVLFSTNNPLIRAMVSGLTGRKDENNNQQENQDWRFFLYRKPIDEFAFPS